MRGSCFSDRLSIAIIAPSRYPISEPFAGGLEALVAGHTAELRRRGHRVELFAVEGSPGGSERFAFHGVRWPQGAAVSDDSYPPGEREAETASFLQLREVLKRSNFDVIHNHSLHPGPISSARTSCAPTVTTLHTPSFPEMQEAIAGDRSTRHLYTAVSAATASSWQLPQAVRIVANGIDTEFWSEGQGGPGLVWCGRLVPEKGLHLAIDAAALLGQELTVCGRIGDDRYMAVEIIPRLTRSVRHLGECSQSQVRSVVGSSQCLVFTPQWEEPFGLVVAEAMSCGTPVAALRRGAVVEVLGPFAAACSTSGTSASDLVSAITAASKLPRGKLRAYALANLSTARMVDEYEVLYREVMLDGAQ